MWAHRPELALAQLPLHARYHDSKWSMYGTEQRGIRLGDPANYPLPGGR